MNKDLISVVVIVYNTSKYLKDCLETIVNQTYKNLEIIVVNDGSKDNSADIINDYKKLDNRIKFIDRKQNKGTLYTRKEGFDNSTGKYITFVDSDDLLELNAIEKMYEELKKANCDIVKCNHSVYKDNKVTESNDRLKGKLYNKDEYEPEFYDLIYKDVLLNVMWGMLIDRKCLKDMDKLDLSMIYGEDLCSNLYMFNNTKKILIIDDCLYKYRKNNESITYTFNKDKLIKKINDSIKTYLFALDYIDVFKIKDKDKYRELTKLKLKKYLSMFLLKYCYSQSYREFKDFASIIFSNKELEFLYSKDNKKYSIGNNKMIDLAINLLFKKRYISFYIYSRYIYKNIQKIYYFIKK